MPRILGSVRRLLAIVALGALGSVAACAAIAGLDSFSKGDCSGGGACDGGPDGGVDATRADGGGTGDDGAGDDATSGDAAGGDAAGGDAIGTGDARAGDGGGAADASGDAHEGGGDAAPPSDGGGNDSGGGDGATGDGASGDGPTGDAGSDAEPPDCGPLTSTSNCGACGAVCTPTWASGDSCNGLTCSYTCQSGHSDCNAGVGQNTDGCECTTPGCCTNACQTTHSNGVGQSFYDCNATSTFSLTTALEACTAYAVSVGGTAASCKDGFTCTGSKPPFQVCFVTGSGSCSNFCWGYSGTQGGNVYTCSCPNTTTANWD